MMWAAVWDQRGFQNRAVGFNSSAARFQLLPVWPATAPLCRDGEEVSFDDVMSNRGRGAQGA